MEPERIRKIKKIAIISGIGILLLMGILWLFNHSIILVSADNADSGELRVTLTNEAGEATTAKSSGTSIKKIVSKGTYEVSVQQGGSSYVTFVSTGGFLGEKQINADLASESSRKFVGSQPRSCMDYIGDILLSSNCGEDFDLKQVHTRASQSTPTLVQRHVPKELYGASEGIAHTKIGIVAMVQQAYSEDEPRGHYAAIIGQDLVDTGRTRLQDLATEKTYSIKPFKEGFVAYDSDAQDIFYFKSLTAKPERIKATVTNEKDMRSYAVGVGNNTVVVAYSEMPGDEILESETDTLDDKPYPSIVVVNKDGDTKQFEFDESYTQVLYCGSDRLCLLGNNRLHVYDVSGKEAELQFTVNNAETMEVTSKGPIVVTNKGVLLLSVDNQEGFYEYTFDTYSFCGLSLSASGYVLCVDAGEGDTNALYIDQNNRTSDNIDKKVLGLMGTNIIDFVSPYSNFVHVVPNYGELVYDEARNINLYDPATVTKVNNDINNIVKKENIDTNVYTIINTGQ